ncbi:FAD-dependent oxidoreductase [soil metagenome]
MPTHQKSYDILIAGSGFAGSITALCLNSAGFTVCLVERDRHPRFAIGESSTPIADMILRDLAKKYDLPQLKKLSRYGSWQEHYPETLCGIKRGFSYYKHSKGEPFSFDQNHSLELLVAASVDDQNSDTQWYRPETDQLFVQMVMDAGIDYLDQTDIQSIAKKPSGNWRIHGDWNGDPIELEAGFIIDSTGSPRFSNRVFGTSSANLDFHTNTRAVYSHFENVPRWHSYLTNHGFQTVGYPYNPDHSALHHLLEPGWLWMLRFNSGLLSAGLVLDGQDSNGTAPGQEWREMIREYPSLSNLFTESRLADIPGQLIGTGRLQRRLNKIFGDGWAALHHTAGFVDPLHSTGIAHSLCGVEKILAVLEKSWNNHTKMASELANYEKEFFSELILIDLLVSGCYKSRYHFDLFTAFSMLYFICTITYEQYRITGENFGQFLNADNKQLRSLVHQSYEKLLLILQNGAKKSDRERFINELRKNIKPFNSVGLMDPAKLNMYSHTAIAL